MEEISEDEFRKLIRSFKRTSVHLETRDAYGTETELPHMAKWAAGEPDDLSWLEEYCDSLRAHRAGGRSVRRAMIVSEPLSDYQRWAYSTTQPLVDAGEDLRWVPRRRVSEVCIPGNDYYLLDDERVVFLHYAGSGLNSAFTTTTESATVAMCRDTFARVWSLAIPHSDYKPE
ncbi:DUF6879 family protein [Kribbella sp. NPDC055110]